MEALKGCSSLVKLTVPTSITYTQGIDICRNANAISAYFSSSWKGTVPASFKEVTITGGGELDDDTFNNCRSLDKVSLGTGVTSLPANVFNGISIAELHYEGTKAP